MKIFIFCKISVFLIIVIAIIAFIVQVSISYFFGESIPNLIQLSEGLVFDYIVVGSGTAGSVVSTEIARNSKSTVLLIEAGGQFGRLSKIPLLAIFLQKTKNDWGFLSTVQRFSSKGLIKKKQSLPRGKGLGGTSQLNFMLHSKGLKRDFENWKSLGAINWSFDVMKNYLNCLQPTSSITSSGVNLKCNSNSFVNKDSIIWTIPKNYSLLTETFEKAIKENFGKKITFHRSQYNIKNGERWNVYQMYLKPSFNLENFKILLNTQVEKIIFDKNDNPYKIRSVIAHDINNGKKYEIFARKEIILSAGTYQTPQILQLSGIGLKENLNALNIDTIIDSPQIGKNLFEHLTVPLYVSVNKTNCSLTFSQLISPIEIWNYFTKGTGIYSNFGVIGHISKLNENYGTNVFAIGTIDESSFKSLSNSKTKFFRSVFPFYNSKYQEGFVLLSTCYQPKSRGYVHVFSKNIHDYPIIDLNLLSESDDISCSVKAIRNAVDMLQMKPFRNLGIKIHWPVLDECLELGPFQDDFIHNKPSDEYLECLIRVAGLVSHHPGGTCAIGNTTESCVDNKLRVQGVSGLRVVDASVFPAPVYQTPNSIIIAVAKRAVELILNN